MANYVVFDNGGITIDRYTIVDWESGNVFAAGEGASTARYFGNCADHRVTLFGSGWRQMPLSRRIVEAETSNYIRNARLNPGWLGNELPREHWSGELQDCIDRLVKPEMFAFPLFPDKGRVAYR
jgi:hypothetical protein